MAVSFTPAIKGIDIVAYLVKDVDRAKAFYRDTLGMPVSLDYGPQGAEFTLGDGATFGLWDPGEGGFQPSSGVMFAVDDVRTAVDQLKQAGVEFEADGAVHEFPACFMAMAKDTEGNGFILHQRKSA